jgi:hypothetical protein
MKKGGRCGPPSSRSFAVSATRRTGDRSGQSDPRSRIVAQPGSDVNGHLDIQMSQDRDRRHRQHRGPKRKRRNKPPPKRKPGEYRRVYPWVIRHYRSGKLIRRRDGKRFCIWVKVKRDV